MERWQVGSSNYTCSDSVTAFPVLAATRHTSLQIPHGLTIKSKHWWLPGKTSYPQRSQEWDGGEGGKKERPQEIKMEVCGISRAPKWPLLMFTHTPYQAKKWSQTNWNQGVRINTKTIHRFFYSTQTVASVQDFYTKLTYELWSQSFGFFFYTFTF